MRYYHEQKMHEKCLDLIDLIEYSYKKIERMERDLKLYDKMFSPYTRAEEIEKRITSAKAALLRVEMFYIKTKCKI